MAETEAQQPCSSGHEDTSRLEGGGCDEEAEEASESTASFSAGPLIPSLTTAMASSTWRRRKPPEEDEEDVDSQWPLFFRQRPRSKRKTSLFHLLLLLPVALALCPAAEARTILNSGNPDAKRLYDDLLSNYNKLVRPVVNTTDPLTVRIKLKLSQLIDVVSAKAIERHTVHTSGRV